MVCFPKTTCDTRRPALSATILATFVLTANGTSAQSAKSIAWDIHNMYRCPLNHHVSRPSSLCLLSSSSQPRPIPPPHSHWMVCESSRPPHRFNCPSPPRSPSPIEDFDYNDVTISNMTGSPVRSYKYF